MLNADKFRQDPRIAEAKKLMLAALHDAQAAITGIQGANLEQQEISNALVEQFLHARGLPLYFPYVASGIGRDAFVELMDGSIKYDLISGIGVHYFGHSHPGVMEAAIDAALSDTVMQGNLQQNADSLDLMRLYTKLSGFDHCFLSSSGAMACENSLKICFQKKFPASRVLAFERGFAGRTLALSQITDKPSFREGLPTTIAVDYIPFFDAKNPIESTARALEVLKSHIKRFGNQHAVMCMELIQGEGGFWTASSEFFKAIINVLNNHGIAVWVDEVQTFARTENVFAFQRFDLDGLVDIVTVGKVTPACATLFTKEYCPRPGLLSQTFTASTSAIRTAKYMIEYAVANDFFGEKGKIAQLHQAFTEGLASLHEKYGCLHGPYGMGSMIAFTPFNGSETKVKAFVQKLFINGIVSFVAGSHPTRVRFLLPVGALKASDIDPIMRIIEKTILESMS